MNDDEYRYVRKNGQDNMIPGIPRKTHERVGTSFGPGKRAAIGGAAGSVTLDFAGQCG